MMYGVRIVYGNLLWCSTVWESSTRSYYCHPSYGDEISPKYDYSPGVYNELGTHYKPL